MNNYTEIRVYKNNDGISKVYKIKDSITEKEYVVKEIYHINTPLLKVIFDREVEALKKLSVYDNIINIEHFEIVNNKGDAFGRIFLEYVSSEKTLSQIDVLELSNHTKFKIVKDLIIALQSAHENNIIHRDINPNNIMINDDYSIKLIDFGISKIKDMVNSDTVYQFATNKYSAPEVHINSENATEKSDIYSLGAVIYYLFTGKEPPIASEFITVLENEGGIDVVLKEILKKLVSSDIKERPLNIYAVRKVLSELLDKYTKSTDKYTIIIDYNKVNDLKRLNLVTYNKRLPELLDIEIKDNFQESWVSVEKDGEEFIFSIYGDQYSFNMTYDEKKSAFFVYRVYKLYSDKKEKWRKDGYYVNGHIEFISDYKRLENNNNHELFVKLKGYYEEYLSDKHVNYEYGKQFFAWHKFLEILKDEYRKNAISVPYFSVSKKSEYLYFEIESELYYELDESNNEKLFIMELNTRKDKRKKIIEIGYIVFLDVDKEKYFVCVKISNLKLNVKNIPSKGVLIEDYRLNTSQIEKELSALNLFNHEQYSSTSNLKGIFAGLHQASTFLMGKKFQLFNENLDVSQKKAVEKALNSKDIALIQGPPGTGKTSVIIEIIKQIISKNNEGEIFKSKILLVSQAHAAVDKMLEDLYADSDIKNKIIRIGREEKFSAIVKENYAIEKASNTWREKIVIRCNFNIIEMLKAYEVDEEEFDIYLDQVMYNKLEKKESENDIMNFTKFETKHEKFLKSREFKGICIAKEWIRRIPLDKEVGRYFVQNAEIVSGTCTGFLSNPFIREMTFDYLIIDEAAKATFPELIMSIIKSRKVILVGDHKQLPPILDDTLVRRNIKEFDKKNLDIKTVYDSAFEKLFTHIENSNKHILKTQYRMHPVIGSMISQVFYDNEVTNGIYPEKRLHDLKEYKGLSIIWLDTSNMEGKYESKVGKTYQNFLEVDIVKKQLRLIDENNSKQSIGIITPYSGQKNSIRQSINNIQFKHIKKNIIVNSVDAFQGGQKDIIIYSTVRSSKKHKTIGFLKSKERLNVAFSRARCMLIIIGDVKFLGKVAKDKGDFPEIIKYINESENCKIIDYSRWGQPEEEK